METAVGSVVARLGSEKGRAAVLVPANDIIDIDRDHVGSNAGVGQCPVRAVRVVADVARCPREQVVLGPGRLGQIANVFVSCVWVGPADDEHLRIPEDHVGGGRVMPEFERPISVMVGEHFQPDKGG